MKFYNVCNDLSLSLTEEKVTSGYRWIKQDMFIGGQTIQVALGYCTKHKELHYLRTNSEVDIDGKKIR